MESQPQEEHKGEKHEKLAEGGKDVIEEIEIV
jgi:hypothetical protein